jgi:uncharacterized tellurite resistance protein B-like protein
MGMFDRKPKLISEATLTPQEAMLGVILCICASDGEISKREPERMAEVLSTHRMFNGMNETQIKAGLNRMLAFMESDPVDQIVKKCAAALGEKQRIVAFALAVDLSMIDQNIHQGESAMLGLMATELNVSEEGMKNIITVLAMKSGLIDRQSLLLRSSNRGRDTHQARCARCGSDAAGRGARARNMARAARCDRQRIQGVSWFFPFAQRAAGRESDQDDCGTVSARCGGHISDRQTEG